MQLVICAIAPHKPQIVKQLTRALVDSGGGIEEVRLSALGDKISLLLSISGTWNAIAKIENQLPRLQEQLGFTFLVQRSETLPKSTNHLPYMIEVISIYNPEILPNIVRFFSDAEVSIEDINSHTYTIAQLDTLMLSLTLRIHVPNTIIISNLRGDFFDLADEMNLDAVMEPIK
ncbi:glycine cleavage system protein R [Beggiatoa leptomitoformis]|uniref:Glycine cleavage system transcriptional repressor n=1 Tax=Beggiatoa leptomitoformis TaxID=288004 RepID=A0A2N9YG04_9GAMM|nr:ACT domain-containing protein [Beggiatoa leptomitoformis]ALG68261.1 glycine cleavage system protein R [Beggiatoa leptomitoformis]AUI69430.1 glycine cleavage system protein R [Beggiatoa leptomitoformis]